MVPSVPSEAQPRSRRAVLLAALGGVGAAVAGALTNAVVKPTQVRAGVDDNADMFVGTHYADVELTTQLTNIRGSGTVFRANSSQGINLGSGSGIAIHGTSYSNTGLLGVSTDGTGVKGQSISAYGVHGMTTSATGVLGEATSSDGIALQATGRTKLSTSGVATIGVGVTSRTVTPGVAIGSSSFVLLTPRVSIGTRSLWFTTDTVNDRFTIHMSSSKTTKTPVAWLLLG